MTVRITSYRKMIFSILLLPSLLLGGCFSSCGETSQIQKNMTEGLKKIYGKEFVVGRPHMTGNPGFGYHYEAKAYPKDNPKLEFTVAYNMNQKGDYGDNYLEVLWSHQGDNKLNHILREQYADNYYLRSYWFKYNNIDYKLLNHDEVIAKCDGFANIWIEYYVYTDGPIDKIREAKNILYILDTFMQRNHIKRYLFTVGYCPTSLKGNTKIFLYDNKNVLKGYDELYKENILINHVEIQQSALNRSEIVNLGIAEILKAFKH